MESKMFCWQCQETAGNKGCMMSGVCGKKPDVARMQDLLIYATKGLASVANQLRAEGKPVKARVNHVVTLNLFTTITNANFDRDLISERVEQTLRTKARLLAVVDDKKICPPPRCGLTPANTSTLRQRRLEFWRRTMKTSAVFAS